MLAVNGNDLATVFLGALHNELTCRNDGFLVGKTNARETLDCGKRRTKSRKAADGVDTNVRGKHIDHFGNGVCARQNFRIGIGNGKS